MGEEESRFGFSNQEASRSENKLVAWNPIKEIPRILYCEGIHDDYEGFRVLLKGRGVGDRVLRIMFNGLVAYRNINESYRLTSLPPNGTGTLFRVENSSWIPWICKESGGVLIPENLNHFAIYTPEDFLDIVDDSVPRVDWLS